MSDLILLSIDSLRRDYFSREFFPTCWDTFEQEFASFTNALSNGVATPFSFPYIHTGRHPNADGSLSEDCPTIAEQIDGYRWALTNNPHLRVERGYARGFDDFFDNINDIGTSGTSLGLVRRMKAAGASIPPIRLTYNWIRKTTGVDVVPQSGHAEDVAAQLRHVMADRSGFFWAHFMDPHYPFEPRKIEDSDLSVDRSQSEINAINERFNRGESTKDDLNFVRSMYGETVRYLDRTLASLFEDLKREGRWDQSLVILASDHGEAFGEEGVFNHHWDADPIDPLVKVPLLVKFPGRSGETYKHLVQNADLFATIVSELDIEVPVPSTSIPLTDDQERVVVSTSNSAVRVTTPSGYAIRRRDGDTAVNSDVGEDALTVLESTTIPSISRSREDEQASGTFILVATLAISVLVRFVWPLVL